MTGHPLKPPKELDAIVDLVFAYKAKPKRKTPKKRGKPNKEPHGSSSGSSSARGEPPKPRPA